MPPRPPAHLMLPSPLGLLEYDVLEDAVFLGPGRKGGLRASPTPFQGAQVALTRGPDGFVARPLPGEAAPEINGEVVAERVLEDGDRIRLGEPVAMFRTGRGRVEAKPTPAAEAPPPRPPRVERREAPRRQNPTAAIVMFTGLILLLAAAYRAANHMKALQSARSAGDDLPELEAYQPQEPGRIAVELAELNEEVLVNPRQFQAALQNFRAFQRRHVGTVEAEIAGERVRELMAAWSADERKSLNTHVEKLIAAQQYARALAAIHKFESRFGTTEAAADLDSLANRVRAEADATLEKLITRVSPLIRRQPREAHRMLISVSHQFPPDQASRVVHLVERCVQRMLETGPQRQPARDGGPRVPAKGPEPVAPKKAEPERGPPQPIPPPKGDDRQRDAQCADAWRVARARLLRADYADALQAYTLVQQQYGNTALYREHKAKIAAGRRAARAGALGPQALVNVPVEVKKG